MTDGYNATDLVRGGLDRSGWDETSEALILTSGFVYGSAEEAEAAFAGEQERYIYSRYGNPTIGMFQERLRIIEGAEACSEDLGGKVEDWAARHELDRRHQQPDPALR